MSLKELSTQQRELSGQSSGAQGSSRLARTSTIAHQAPLSMGFPRKEYWNGLPFSPPEDLPDPGIEPGSPALAGGFFTTEPPEKTSSNQQVQLKIHPLPGSLFQT